LSIEGEYFCLIFSEKAGRVTGSGGARDFFISQQHHGQAVFNENLACAIPDFWDVSFPLRPVFTICT